MSYNYFTWRVLEDISKKNIRITDLSNEFIEELCFTILPDHRTVIHFMQNNYQGLMDFLNFIREDPDELIEKTTNISDIPFIPDINGNTPIHESLEKNNTSITDQLLLNLKDATFDHHCRYII